MSKKLKHSYIKQYFKDNNCELLEKEYINNLTKMKYRCSCGDISEITFNSFKRGSRCFTCGKEKMAEKQRLTYDYVKDMFRFSGCELLEKEYKNCMVLMKYRCSCGNMSKITFNQFQQGQRCAKCGGTEKLTIEYVKGFFEEQGCELLEKEYVNNRTKMRYMCKCGNYSKIGFDSFKMGRRCMKCRGSEKLIYEYVEQYFKEQGCELIEKEYVNNRTKMRYKCDCGSISEICFSDFKQGRRCKKCGYEKISGENHWNYDSSLTDEDRQDRRLIDGYLQWIKSIYKNNNYTCQKCIKRGGKLNAHHIENYSANKGLRVDMNNGICFCESCHKQFHKKYGKRNNNKQQLDQFIGDKNGILCRV